MNLRKSGVVETSFYDVLTLKWMEDSLKDTFFSNIFFLQILRFILVANVTWCVCKPLTMKSQQSDVKVSAQDLAFIGLWKPLILCLWDLLPEVEDEEENECRKIGFGRVELSEKSRIPFM